MQDSLAQQIGLSSAVPHSPDQFDTANLTFTLGGVPWCGQCQLDVFVVLTEASSHRSKLLQARLSSLVGRGLQRFDITLADDSSELFLQLVSSAE